MDQIQLQQKISEYYVKLPENLQIFFASQEWLNNLSNISLKYKLNQEQLEILTTETTLLLLCIINIEEYVRTINTETKLPTETLDSIFSEIGDLILKDNYQSIKEGFIKNAEMLEKQEEIEMLDVPLPPYKKEEAKMINELENSTAEKDLVDQTKKDVNFLAKKLSQPTITPSSVSNHSLPSLNKDAHQSNPIKNSHDPYREGIEL